jgi:hypothetical protein
MKPDLDAVAVEYGGVDLVILDAAADPESVARLRVFGTPTLIAVRDGVEIARFTGRRTRGELRELFSQMDTSATITAPRVGRSDRQVWTLGGVALAGVGLLLGPAWLLVALGTGLAAYANSPWSRRGRRF